jgi:hypothetical protein
LGLVAAGSHHRVATNVDHVDSESHRQETTIRQTETPAADPHTLVGNPALLEEVVDAPKRMKEREGDVAREGEWPGTREARSPTVGTARQPCRRPKRA